MSGHEHSAALDAWACAETLRQNVALLEPLATGTAPDRVRYWDTKVAWENAVIFATALQQQAATA